MSSREYEMDRIHASWGADVEPALHDGEAAKLNGRTPAHEPIVLARLDGLLHRRRSVIVGPALGVHALGERLARARWLLDHHEVGLDGDATNGRLLERLRAESPDEVYFVVGGDLDEQALAAAGSTLLMDGVAVHVVLPDPTPPPIHALIARVGGRSLVSLYAVRDGLVERAARRAIDLAGALLALGALSPLFAAVALAVWWKIGRPIIFVHRRLGRAGRPFRLYKFRSMRADAEQALRASPEAYRRYVDWNFKLPDDGRITPLGRFLRRASLDELPQLWNVLKGDMSLVGPRPIVPEEIAQYGDYGRMLLRVKPGLTGLWQVSGRSEIGYPERARLDLQYVGGRSLERDLRILIRTLPAVIRMRGAL